MMSRKWATFERCYPKVGFQQFFMCVGRRKISSFPCNVAVNEESKMYLKIFKFVKGESGMTPIQKDGEGKEKTTLTNARKEK